MSKFPFFILLFTVLQADIVNQGRAYEYFLKGEYALLNKNYSKAEIEYSKALSLAPNSPTILQSLVDLKSYQGEYADAIKYLEIIIDLSPENKEAGLELCNFYIQGGDLDKANQLLDTLSIYHSDDIELFYSRANIQYLNKDWANLLKTYQLIHLADLDNTDILNKIYEIGFSTGHESIILNLLQEIHIKNETPLILEILVELLTGMNKYSKAIYYLQKLIAIDEGTEQQTISLGKLYLLNKQFDNVITTLEPIYESGNHSLDLLQLLLIAYSKYGKSDEQITISMELTAEYPELSIGYEALAFAYLEVGEEVNALTILHQALNKFPNEVTYPNTIANIYYQTKNYYQAEKYFMLALELNPEMFSIHHTLAIMFEDMADTARSDSLFKYMFIQNKNDAIGLNDYAYIISERNNSSINELNYALELVERAIYMEPENAAFLDTIGWIYYKMGSYHKALEYVEKSLIINEDNPVILEHMGDIYHQLNEQEQALLIYKKVLEKDSNNKLLQDKINYINGR